MAVIYMKANRSVKSADPLKQSDQVHSGMVAGYHI